MSQYFQEIKTWELPRLAFRDSITLMADPGRTGREGIVLWFGKRYGTRAVITLIASCEGAGIFMEPDYLELGPEAMDQLTELAIRTDTVLVGQIHSHGPYHGINLSPTDRWHGISFPYYLSLVAPNYAQDPNTAIGDCGVHVCVRGHEWIRLTSSEIDSSLFLTDSPYERVALQV